MKKIGASIGDVREGLDSSRARLFSPGGRLGFFETLAFTSLCLDGRLLRLVHVAPLLALSACNLAFQFVQVSAGLVSAFIDMGRQRPPAQRVAQLTAQEPVGGIAGSA